MIMDEIPSTMVGKLKTSKSINDESQVTLAAQ